MSERPRTGVRSRFACRVLEQGTGASLPVFNQHRRQRHHRPRHADRDSALSPALTPSPLPTTSPASLSLTEAGTSPAAMGVGDERQVLPGRNPVPVPEEHQAEIHP
jgi:hypothetical protein